LSKSDREIIVRLPLEWIIELITLCPKESKLAILSLVKHYITIRVLQQTSTSSSEENEGEHQNVSTPVTTGTTDDEKRRIIDEVVKALGDTVEEFPLVWLNSVYEKAVELKCESETILSSYITQAVLNSPNLDNGTENIPDDIMTKLLERVNKHKEDHIKDPQVLTKVIHCYL
jgi:hypothetical protein